MIAEYILHKGAVVIAESFQASAIPIAAISQSLLSKPGEYADSSYILPFVLVVDKHIRHHSPLVVNEDMIRTLVEWSLQECGFRDPQRLKQRPNQQASEESLALLGKIETATWGTRRAIFNDSDSIKSNIRLECINLDGFTARIENHASSFLIKARPEQTEGLTNHNNLEPTFARCLIRKHSIDLLESSELRFNSPLTKLTQRIFQH